LDRARTGGTMEKRCNEDGPAGPGRHYFRTAPCYMHSCLLVHQNDALQARPRTDVLPQPPLGLMNDSKGWIFAAGIVALAFSIYLWFSGNADAAIFVGLWVPSLWILADLVEQTELAAQ